MLVQTNLYDKKSPCYVPMYAIHSSYLPLPTKAITTSLLASTHLNLSTQHIYLPPFILHIFMAMEDLTY